MADKKSKRRNLGRGLDALLGHDSDEDYASLDRVRGTKTVPVEALQPNSYQPRRIFDPEELDALARSVKEKGILQPLLVRRSADDSNRYEIIAGERRWRAAQSAQLHEIPVIIRDLSDKEALEVALVENVQRTDLSPLEEAEGYHRLMEEFSHTQAGLSRAVGKSRSHVANLLRLLGLPDSVKELLESGKLTAGHARALLNTANPEEMARTIVARGLNVRQTERLAQSERGQRPSPAHRGEPDKSIDTVALEKELADLLGLQVNIVGRGNGGQLIIRYKTLEQLDEVLQRLSRRNL